MATAIKVENVSKAYQLGVIGTGTLSNDLKRWYARSRGKEDPFLKIGETNDRSVKGESDVVWSLKDISFEIEQGEAVGIIGRNGAGKSTLLKILSRVTSPTTGKITGNGRVASLLEVGTGFHPELTGKENIYLNGAILGMRKKEIKRKFEEIVDFAGVDRYIDTPVKRYSSGMYVRLAFAVAAYLESEILIVDEVLAVGDAEFQKKCLGKMNEVSKGEGRTVLFVSHNMDSITRLCSTALLLKNGFFETFENTNKVVKSYLESHFGTNSTKKWLIDNSPGNDVARLLKVSSCDSNNVSKDVFDISEFVNINIEYVVLKPDNKLSIAINFFNSSGINIFDSHETNTQLYKQYKSIGYYKSTVCIPKNLLAEGLLMIGVAIVTHDPFKVHLHEKETIAFNMVDKTKNNLTRGVYSGNMPGIIRPLLDWNSVKIE